MKGICHELAENPEKIKKKEIRLVDEDFSTIYSVNTEEICRALSEYSSTQDDFCHDADIYKPDLQHFLWFIEGFNKEKPRVKSSGNKLQLIKRLGKALKDDPEAFLCPIDIFTQSIKELLDSSSEMYEKNIVETVYRNIVTLCGMLAKSSYYNYKENVSCANVFFLDLTDEIRRRITLYSLNSDEETINKLLKLLDETKYMVYYCGIPNVCERWLEANPHLRFYDPVFDIHHNSPEIYRQIVEGTIQGIHFSFIPSEDEFDLENDYRKIQEKRRETLKETLDVQYQNEVICAVTKLFRQDFKQIFPNQDK